MVLRYQSIKYPVRSGSLAESEIQIHKEDGNIEIYVSYPSSEGWDEAAFLVPIDDIKQLLGE